MNILIAYDGSNAATAALEDLTRAGLPQQADTIVLTVADIWLPPSGVKTSELHTPVTSRGSHPERAISFVVNRISCRRRLACLVYD